MAEKFPRALVALVAAFVISIGLAVVTPGEPALARSVVTQTAAHDLNGGGPDVIGVSATGALMLFSGTGSGWFRPGSAQIGVGWGGYEEVQIIGDLTGDGHPDVVGRRPAGDLVLFSGTGESRLSLRRFLGTGWDGFSHIFSPGDWNGDGLSDIVGIATSDGTLRYYPTNSVGWGFLRPSIIGEGWGSITALIPTGDFDGNGRGDFLARNTAGDLYLFQADSSGGLTPSLAGTGWGGFTGLVGTGDFNGDSYSDVLARTSDGKLWLYRGNGNGGFLSGRTLVGSGWNSISFP